MEAWERMDHINSLVSSIINDLDAESDTDDLESPDDSVKSKTTKESTNQSTIIPALPFSEPLKRNIKSTSPTTEKRTPPKKRGRPPKKRPKPDDFQEVFTPQRNTDLENQELVRSITSLSKKWFEEQVAYPKTNLEDGEESNEISWYEDRAQRYPYYSTNRSPIPSTSFHADDSLIHTKRSLGRSKINMSNSNAKLDFKASTNTAQILKHLKTPVLKLKRLKESDIRHYSRTCTSPPGFEEILESDGQESPLNASYQDSSLTKQKKRGRPPKKQMERDEMNIVSEAAKENLKERHRSPTSVPSFHSSFTLSGNGCDYSSLLDKTPVLKISAIDKFPTYTPNTSHSHLLSPPEKNLIPSNNVPNSDNSVTGSRQLGYGVILAFNDNLNTSQPRRDVPKTDSSQVMNKDSSLSTKQDLFDRASAIFDQIVQGKAGGINEAFGGKINSKREELTSVCRKSFDREEEAMYSESETELSDTDGQSPPKKQVNKEFKTNTLVKINSSPLIKIQDIHRKESPLVEFCDSPKAEPDVNLEKRKRGRPPKLKTNPPSENLTGVNQQSSSPSKYPIVKIQRLPDEDIQSYRTDRSPSKKRNTSIFSHAFLSPRARYSTSIKHLRNRNSSSLNRRLHGNGNRRSSVSDESLSKISACTQVLEKNKIPVVQLRAVDASTSHLCQKARNVAPSSSLNKNHSEVSLYAQVLKTSKTPVVQLRALDANTSNLCQKAKNVAPSSSLNKNLSEVSSYAQVLKTNITPIVQLRALDVDSSPQYQKAQKTASSSEGKKGDLPSYFDLTNIGDFDNKFGQEHTQKEKTKNNDPHPRTQIKENPSEVASDDTGNSENVSEIHEKRAPSSENKRKSETCVGLCIDNESKNETYIRNRGKPRKKKRGRPKLKNIKPSESEESPRKQNEMKSLIDKMKSPIVKLSALNSSHFRHFCIQEMKNTQMQTRALKSVKRAVQVSLNKREKDQTSDSELDPSTSTQGLDHVDRDSVVHRKRGRPSKRRGHQKIVNQKLRGLYQNTHQAEETEQSTKPVLIPQVVNEIRSTQDIDLRGRRGRSSKFNKINRSGRIIANNEKLSNAPVLRKKRGRPPIFQINDRNSVSRNTNSKAIPESTKSPKRIGPLSKPGVIESSSENENIESGASEDDFLRVEHERPIKSKVAKESHLTMLKDNVSKRQPTLADVCDPDVNTTEILPSPPKKRGRPSKVKKDYLNESTLNEKDLSPNNRKNTPRYKQTPKDEDVALTRKSQTVINSPLHFDLPVLKLKRIDQEQMFIKAKEGEMRKNEVKNSTINQEPKDTVVQKAQVQTQSCTLHNLGSTDKAVDNCDEAPIKSTEERLGLPFDQVPLSDLVIKLQRVDQQCTKKTKPEGAKMVQKKQDENNMSENEGDIKKEVKPIEKELEKNYVSSFTSHNESNENEVSDDNADDTFSYVEDNEFEDKIYNLDIDVAKNDTRTTKDENSVKEVTINKQANDADDNSGREKKFLSENDKNLLKHVHPIMIYMPPVGAGSAMNTSEVDNRFIGEVEIHANMSGEHSENELKPTLQDTDFDEDREDVVFTSANIKQECISSDEDNDDGKGHSSDNQNKKDDDTVDDNNMNDNTYHKDQIVSDINKRSAADCHDTTKADNDEKTKNTQKFKEENKTETVIGSIRLGDQTKNVFDPEIDSNIKEKPEVKIEKSENLSKRGFDKKNNSNESSDDDVDNGIESDNDDPSFSPSHSNEKMKKSTEENSNPLLNYQSIIDLIEFRDDGDQNRNTGTNGLDLVNIKTENNDSEDCEQSSIRSESDRAGVVQEKYNRALSAIDDTEQCILSLVKLPEKVLTSSTITVKDDTLVCSGTSDGPSPVKLETGELEEINFLLSKVFGEDNIYSDSKVKKRGSSSRNNKPLIKTEDGDNVNSSRKSKTKAVNTKIKGTSVNGSHDDDHADDDCFDEELYNPTGISESDDSYIPTDSFKKRNRKPSENKSKCRSLETTSDVLKMSSQAKKDERDLIKKFQYKLNLCQKNRFRVRQRAVSTAQKAMKKSSNKNENTYKHTVEIVCKYCTKVEIIQTNWEFPKEIFLRASCDDCVKNPKFKNVNTGATVTHRVMKRMNQLSQSVSVIDMKNPTDYTKDRQKLERERSKKDKRPKPRRKRKYSSSSSSASSSATSSSDEDSDSTVIYMPSDDNNGETGKLSIEEVNKNIHDSQSDNKDLIEDKNAEAEQEELDDIEIWSISSSERISLIEKAKQFGFLQVSDCEICGYTPSTFRDNVYHKWFEHSVKDCPECDVGFILPEQLHTHLFVHNLTDDQDCQICVSTVECFGAHLNVIHRIKPCLICGVYQRRFRPTQIHCERHRYLKITKDPQYLCPNVNCSFKIYSLDTLMLHMWKYHDEKNCQFCRQPVVFKTLSSLLYHCVTEHSQEIAQFQPPKLDGKFTLKQNLWNLRNLIVKPDFPVFTCEVCSWKCKGTVALAKHLWMLHNITSCKKCGTEFKTPLHHSTHMLIEYLKDNTCWECGIVTRSIVDLRDHLWDCHKYRGCFICHQKCHDKAELLKKHLVQHRKMSLGTFRCPYALCGHTNATNLEALCKHLSYHGHTQCIFCDQFTFHSGNLLDHVHMHLKDAEKKEGGSEDNSRAIHEGLQDKSGEKEEHEELNKKEKTSEGVDGKNKDHRDNQQSLETEKDISQNEIRKEESHKEQSHLRKEKDGNEKDKEEIEHDVGNQEGRGEENVDESSTSFKGKNKNEQNEKEQNEKEDQEELVNKSQKNNEDLSEKEVENKTGNDGDREQTHKENEKDKNENEKDKNGDGKDKNEIEKNKNENENKKDKNENEKDQSENDNEKDKNENEKDKNENEKDENDEIIKEIEENGTKINQISKKGNENGRKIGQTNEMIIMDNRENDVEDKDVGKSEINENMPIKEQERGKGGERKGISTVLCPECPFKAPNANVLCTHLWDDHGLRFCPFCNLSRKFKNPDGFALHYLDHILHPKHVCLICKEPTYSAKFQLTHMLKKHGAIRTFIACKLCHHEFLHPRTAINHAKSHLTKRSLPVKVYTCKECNVEFHVKAKYDNHCRNVHPKMVYLCEFCGMKFTSKNVKDNHVRSHTGEKPYQCPICDKGFARTDNLHTHMRSHSGVKPYVCDKCGKGFTRGDNLKTHKRLMHSKKSK